MKNFYPKQYSTDSEFQINHNYLKNQFIDYKEIFQEIEKIIINCDYTLLSTVDEVEEIFLRKLVQDSQLSWKWYRCNLLKP